MDQPFLGGTGMSCFHQTGNPQVIPYLKLSLSQMLQERAKSYTRILPLLPRRETITKALKPLLGRLQCDHIKFLKLHRNPLLAFQFEHKKETYDQYGCVSVCVI